MWNHHQFHFSKQKEEKQKENRQYWLRYTTTNFKGFSKGTPKGTPKWFSPSNNPILFTRKGFYIQQACLKSKEKMG
jgi:hypothetical protein